MYTKHIKSSYLHSYFLSHIYLSFNKPHIVNILLNYNNYIYLHTLFFILIQVSLLLCNVQNY